MYSDSIGQFNLAELIVATPIDWSTILFFDEKEANFTQDCTNEEWTGSLPNQEFIRCCEIKVSMNRRNLMKSFNILLLLIDGNYGAAVFLSVTLAIHLTFDYYKCDKQERFRLLQKFNQRARSCKRFIYSYLLMHAL